MTDRKKTQITISDENIEITNCGFEQKNNVKIPLKTGEDFNFNDRINEYSSTFEDLGCNGGGKLVQFDIRREGDEVIFKMYNSDPELSKVGMKEKIKLTVSMDENGKPVIGLVHNLREEDLAIMNFSDGSTLTKDNQRETDIEKGKKLQQQKAKTAAENIAKVPRTPGEKTSPPDSPVNLKKKSTFDL